MNETIEILKDLLDLYTSSINMTDTFCDVCETHARKYVDKRGDWTGKVDPIQHKPDCVIGRAETAIAKVQS